MNIKHIFFDLDRTLWDFEENSRATLLDLIFYFNLLEKGVDSPESFICKYKVHNDKLWDLYRNNQITKEDLRSRRFLLTLKEYGIEDLDLAERFGLAYIKKSPHRTKTFPFAHKLLSYLDKKYHLHIITNGFEEVQDIKLIASGLKKYFDVIVTSEKAGVKKPNPKIFKFALEATNATRESSIMIGDDLEADIFGAENVGIKAIYFNPDKTIHEFKINNEIYCLSQLMKIL